MLYPPDWPKCPHCGEPCMDGKATCGDVRCVSAVHGVAASRTAQVEAMNHAAFALAYPFCSQADALKIAAALPVDAEIVSAHVRAGK